MWFKIILIIALGIGIFIITKKRKNLINLKLIIIIKRVKLIEKIFREIFPEMDFKKAKPEISFFYR